MPRGWGYAAPKERGRVERALCERGYNADATLLVSFVNHNDDILGAKIRRKNVKRDILHKNIAPEYDILQEITFQNAIFYITTPHF